MPMKRTKLINDPAELVALFRSVDSPDRRAVLARLAEGWTPTSELQEMFGEKAFGAITYFEKFKLVESRWEVSDGKPPVAGRPFQHLRQRGLAGSRGACERQQAQSPFSCAAAAFAFASAFAFALARSARCLALKPVTILRNLL